MRKIWVLFVLLPLVGFLAACGSDAGANGRRGYIRKLQSGTSRTLTTLQGW